MADWGHKILDIIKGEFGVVIALLIGLFLYGVLLPLGDSGFTSALSSVSQTYGNTSTAYTYLQQAQSVYLGLGFYIALSLILSVIVPLVALFIAEKTGRSFDAELGKIGQVVVALIIMVIIIAIVGVGVFLPLVVNSLYQANVSVNTVSETAQAIYIMYIIFEVLLIFIAVSPVIFSGLLGSAGEGVLMPQA